MKNLRWCVPLKKRYCYLPLQESFDHLSLGGKLKNTWTNKRRFDIKYGGQGIIGLVCQTLNVISASVFSVAGTYNGGGKVTFY